MVRSSSVARTRRSPIRTIADIESAMVIRSLHRQDHLSQIEIGALLDKYIVRACFSQQRMVYISVEKSVNGVAKVIYTSRDGRSQKTFDALDWLAMLVTHIPCRYEQTVRCYGYYSNKSRGLRIKSHAGFNGHLPQKMTR